MNNFQVMCIRFNILVLDREENFCMYWTVIGGKYIGDVHGLCIRIINFSGQRSGNNSTSNNDKNCNCNYEV